MEIGTRSGTIALIASLLVSAAVGCTSAPRGLEPTLEFPKPRPERALLGDFTRVVQVTAAVDELAVRRRPLGETVDREIAAMLDYVRAHGRGTIDVESLRGPPDEALERLARASVRLSSHLELESGPSVLAEVAVAALAKQLGPDGRTDGGSPASKGALTDFVPDFADGIAFLWLGKLDQRVQDRVFTVLGEWGANARAPRAIVLDLSDCEDGDPAAAAALANLFAPGKPSLGILMRNSKTGERMGRFYRGEAPRGSKAYASVPLFIVTSSHTGTLAEALALALRQHRSAELLGAATFGSGRLWAWADVGPHSRLGFAYADVVGADGLAQRDRPLVPDACVVGGALSRLSSRSLDGFRAQCGDGDVEVPRPALVEYVRQRVPAKNPEIPGTGPLEYGEQHG